MIWFTSDTHFGHEKIIRYCKRPFKDAQEQDEVLIKNWNSVVTDSDMVYHLGDFSFGNGKEWREVRGRLNGQVCLVKGNHDKQIPAKLFQWVKDLYELDVDGQHIVLCHYGMRTWHHDLRGTWHLYGHSHGGLPPYGKSMDVGVDKWDYRPISFDEVKQSMDKKEIGNHPMFEEWSHEESVKEGLLHPERLLVCQKCGHPISASTHSYSDLGGYECYRGVRHATVAL